VLAASVSAYTSCLAESQGQLNPRVDWVQYQGTSETVKAEDVAIDSNGDILVAGWTRGILGAENFGYSDIFISKYDDVGSRLWTKQFGSESGDYVEAISTSNNGSFYLGGSTYAGLGIDLNSESAAFLSKLDTHGELIWMRHQELDNQTYVTDVFADSIGNVFTTGASTNASGLGVGDTNGFISKYDGEGNLAWSQAIEIDGNVHSRGVASDSAGNAYVAGWVGSDLDFNSSYMAPNAFLAKYDPNGEIVWFQDFGTDDLEFGQDVAVDQEGNIYVAGTTQGDLVRPIAGIGYRRVDTFIRKFDPEGSAIWTQQIGFDQREYVEEIAVDETGDIYIAGFTEGTLGESSNGGTDPYVAKLDSNGSML